MTAQLEAVIDAAWDTRDTVGTATTGDVRDAVNAALSLLDGGERRVAEKVDGVWTVNQWLKKAVLLSFRLNDNVITPGPGGANWFDKVPSKFADWGENRFREAGFRAVPGSIVRAGAHIGRNVVLMPSFVNIGASVGDGSMVDAWATVGSCAQIGKNVHLSGGVGIGGVLEPLQAGPVIIEDNCFIGARSEVVEGVIVEENSVISMGDHRVQVFGRVAINTGFYTRTAQQDGKPVQSPARFSFVYEKRGGQWLIVNHHSSAFPQP